MSNVLFALPALLGGLVISLVNYFITRTAIKKGGAAFALAGPLRMLLCAAYLAALYFISRSTSAPPAALLVGGALGLSAGLAASTYILMKSQDGK